MHAGVKPIGQCESSFLKQDIFIYEGKKQFKCPICNAKFSRLGSLEGHVTRFHKKKKPFRSDTTKKIVKKSNQTLNEKSARLKNIEDQITRLRRDFDDLKESENASDNDFDSDSSISVTSIMEPEVDEFILNESTSLTVSFFTLNYTFS